MFSETLYDFIMVGIVLVEKHPNKVSDLILLSLPHVC